MASNRNSTPSGKADRLRAWTHGHRAAKAQIAAEEQILREAEPQGRHSRATAPGPTVHELTARLAARMPEPQGSDVDGKRRKEER